MILGPDGKPVAVEPIAKVPAHRRCTVILPAMPREKLPAGLPHWAYKRTHVCWCSAWRETRNGLRIWRRGAWRKPQQGELRMIANRWSYR